ncbi:C39 family peptidase [Chroococcidiopsis sp.]|uniref:C39 family peptidase n=1 Tax=Chroococcidiopsis sp. TaxID=3088168 RepID=UPI003F2FF321
MVDKVKKSTGNTVLLDVPYKSQLDNYHEPFATCNTTSFAMCLEYFGITSDKLPGDRHIQLEDKLFKYMSDAGLNKHSPQDLQECAKHFGVNSGFTSHGTFEKCRSHLDAGLPFVMHGYFTQPGHIIVGTGYDDNGFFVHDPYGEWFSTGYRTDLPGENLHYSYELIRKTCAYDGEFWVHYFSPF